MSLTVTRTNLVRVVETLTGTFVSPSDATVTYDGMSTSQTLTGSTTIPVTKHSEDEVTMSSGSGSINLVALPGKSADQTVDGTGLKVQKMILKNKTGNANSITVAKGASNGYGVNAAGTTWTVSLSPGQQITFDLEDAAPDIASGARLIDITGTGSQILQFTIVMG